MALEDKGAQHDKVPIDKYHDPAVSYVMTTRDYVMRPSVSAASIVITLPPVAMAKGRFYSIILRGVENAKTATVEDNNDDSECWGGDYTLATVCDKLLLYSDGLAWLELDKDIQQV